MRIHLYGAELSLIPETDQDHDAIKSFMASMEANDNNLVGASLDGQNMDEIVFQPLCKGDASHCQLCGRLNA